MLLRDIMTTAVVTVAPDATLAAIREIFDKARFHHVIVLDDDQVVGIVSDRDMFKSLSPFLRTAAEQSRDRATLHRRVHQIMTRHVVTASPEADVRAAARLMVRHSIRALPILGADGALEGIVSWKDIMRLIVEDDEPAANSASAA